jgi:hypothetical protein
MNPLHDNVVALARDVWGTGDVRVSFAPPIKGAVRCGVALIRDSEVEEQIWGSPQRNEEEAMKALVNKLSLMKKEE